MQPRTISAARAAVLVAGLAIALAPAPALAKFKKVRPSPLSRGVSVSPQVASNARGDTIVVWRVLGDPNKGTTDAIKARVRPARGNFFHIETVRTAEPGCCGLRDPQVAIDAQGNAIVVWSNLNVQDIPGNLSAHIEASFRPAGGTFGPVEALGCSKDQRDLCPLGLEPQVAMNAEGDAVVAWHGREFHNGFTGDKGAFATVRPAGGPFGPIKQLEGFINGSNQVVIPAFNVRAAIDAAGNALLAWKSEPEGHDVQIVARSLSAAGKLGTYEVIRPVTSESFTGPEIAMDGRGNAIAVWFDSAVHASSRPPKGVWSDQILAEGQFGDHQNLTVAMDANATSHYGKPVAGNAIVAWLRTVTVSPGGANVEARTRPAGRGKFGRTRVLHHEIAHSGLALWDVRAAIAGDNAVVAWTLDQGTIQAITGSSLTEFGKVETLSPDGQQSVSSDVAIDADGNAFVVWQNNAPPAHIEAADNRPPL